MSDKALALSFMVGGAVIAAASLALSSPVLLLPAMAWTVFGVLIGWASKK